MDNKNLQITIKINTMLELGPDENNTVGKTDTEKLNYYKKSYKKV